MGPLLALGSALSFGLSDFTGGLAARRASALTVTLVAQVAGLLVLVPALVLWPGRASWQALGLGALAGGLGCVGLVLYLRCMALGPMGLISPLAALVGAAVPVGWGVVLAGEVLTTADVVGVLTGLVAVVLVAYRPGTSLREAGTRGPLMAAVAGVSFGLFFVLLDATPTDSGLWPLLGSRLAGGGVLLAILALRPRPWPTERGRTLAATSGLTDQLANVLFLLATRAGLLSLASLLTSLYPVVVVVLARQLLHERLTRLQSTGVALALLATALIVV
ncbi:EamA family transporter [Egicoccus sp. AB-alg2]|uniref:EamA family transporter n=1 Tax=Egicoccus sp. AB-alg2 TaxID=3242693 RepID=UPI00359E591D